MAILTIKSETPDSHIRSSSFDPATAAEAGSLSAGSSTTDIESGLENKLGTYKVREGFFYFDTSILGTVDINTVTLELWLDGDNSDTDFTLEARIGSSWADDAQLQTVDWVVGSALGSNTLVATLSSSGVTVKAYNTFTDVALTTNINTSGNTYIVISSEDQRTLTNSVPNWGDKSYLDFKGADITTKAPKLVVDYTPVAPQVCLGAHF